MPNGFAGQIKGIWQFITEEWKRRRHDIMPAKIVFVPARVRKIKNRAV